MGLDCPTLAYLMPWLREVLADFDQTMLPVEASQAERKAIDKEVATIMRDANVLLFPRMSKQFSAIARSGRALFGQYRMLEAAYARETLAQSVITVERTPSLLEPWLKEHMAEMRDEWQDDTTVRYARQAEALRIRAAKKFNKANPEGK
jgi:hypothetical protein